MMDFDLSTIIGGAIVLLFICLILKYKFKKDNTYLVLFSVFFIYILNVLKYTIFPIPVNHSLIESMRNYFTVFHFNLVPFHFPVKDIFHNKQVILNIILTLPFGFGISYLVKASKYQSVFLCLLFGLTIEGVQLAISLILGFSYRAFDIDDIIFNFFGGLIGLFLFLCFSWIIVFSSAKFDVHYKNKMFDYIYEVSKRSIQSR